MVIAQDAASRKRRAFALGLICPQLRPAVRRAAASFDLELEFTSRVDMFVTRIEASYPAVLLADTELFGDFHELSHFARSLRPDVKILAVTWFWSEGDGRVFDDVDGILHKPPRRTQWETVLDSMGIERLPGGSPQALAG